MVTQGALLVEVAMMPPFDAITHTASLPGTADPPEISLRFVCGVSEP